MRSLSAALFILVAILLANGQPVEAHEVSINVVCPQSPGAIQVEGIYFTGNPADSEPLYTPVTITGPGGYLEVFTVPSATWAHSFPLGPNGLYHIDWPNAGRFAQDFVVNCPAGDPEPTPEPTPTPERTPPTTRGFPPPTPQATLPPTDTEGTR